MSSLGKHFVEDSHGCGGLPRLCPQRNVLTVRWPSLEPFATGYRPSARREKKKSM